MGLSDRDYMQERARRRGGNECQYCGEKSHPRRDCPNRLKGTDEITEPRLKGLPPNKRRGRSFWLRKVPDPIKPVKRKGIATERKPIVGKRATQSRHTVAPGDQTPSMRKQRLHPMEIASWALLWTGTTVAVLTVVWHALPVLGLPTIPDGWNPLNMLGALDWQTPRGIAMNSTFLALLVFSVFSVMWGRTRALGIVAWLVVATVAAYLSGLLGI